MIIHDNDVKVEICFFAPMRFEIAFFDGFFYG